MGSPPRDQLGEDEARLDRLSEADAVGEEEADAAHPERAHHRHELVRLDGESPRLDGLKRRGAEGLIEKERLVEEAPVGERGRPLGAQVRRDRLEPLEGGEEVALGAAEGPLLASEPVERLLPCRLREDDLPLEAARGDEGAGEERRHVRGSAARPQRVILPRR